MILPSLKSASAQPGESGLSQFANSRSTRDDKALSCDRIVEMLDDPRKSIAKKSKIDLGITGFIFIPPFARDYRRQDQSNQSDYPLPFVRRIRPFMLHYPQFIKF